MGLADVLIEIASGIFPYAVITTDLLYYIPIHRSFFGIEMRGVVQNLDECSRLHYAVDFYCFQINSCQK